MDLIKLKNFKSFKDETEFELAPITILTGKNNSGKSSLLKALLLLDDFLDSENQTVLSFLGKNQHKHKINRFENAKNWTNDNQKIEFTYHNYKLSTHLVFGGSNENDFAFLESCEIKSDILNDSLIIKRLSSTQIELKISQRFINAIIQPQITGNRENKELSTLLEQFVQQKKALKQKISKAKPDVLKELLSQTQAIEQRIKLLQESIRERSRKSSEEDQIYNPVIDIEELDFPSLTIPNLVRLSLMLYFQTDSEENKYTSNRSVRVGLMRLSDLLQTRLSFKTVHLSPNRTHQSRLYFKRNSYSEINEIINLLARKPVRVGTTEDQFLKKWLKKFEIGEDIRIKSVEGSASSLEVLSKKRWINLADKGFGAGQILSILILITNMIREFSMRKGNRIRRTPLILIEEPESNLHPDLQAQLTELFFDAYKVAGLRFVLETHSEYLIRKIQLMVAKDNGIDSDSALIYYLGNEDEGIRKISILPNGKMSEPFGRGFVDEADRMAMELFKLNNKK